MPLIKSPSKAAVGENISELVKSGRPQDQAVAIALDQQRRSGGGRKVKAMDQVFVKRKLASGDNELLRADVISVSGDRVKVKFPNEIHPREVAAADTVPVAEIMGNQARILQNSSIPKIHPGRNSLANWTGR